MAKKKAAKKNTTSKTIKKLSSRDTTEIRGLLLLAFALTIVLSLISFAAAGPETRNWLGIVGYGVGWTFNALFGLGSYFIGVYIAWIGWRMLFRKPLNHLALKSLYVTLSITSICLLLSLLEDTYPTTALTVNNIFYKSTWQRKMHYHLGGAPFYFFYKDMPGFNLLHIFNTLGVAIIFSSTLIAGMFFLAKISPSSLLEKISKLFHKDLNNEEVVAPISKISKVSPIPSSLPIFSQIEKKEKTNVPFLANKETDSDFLRYVKLRIPGNSQLPSSLSSGTTLASQGEMLAIHPETNLTIRPSLSRKEQTEKPIEDNAWKPKKTEAMEFQPTTIPPSIPISKLTSPAPLVMKEKEVEKEPSTKKRREEALKAQSVYNGDFTSFKLPPLSLLTTPKKADHTSLKKDLRRKAEVLEETLLSFGIEAKVGQINCGPTITSFEVHPAIGVKVQKIKTLENDIALNMEAKSIRIIAPIPGKAAVGIEVPNAQPEEVGFKDMLSTYQQEGRKFNIPILLGKAVNGDFVMSDLSKMPHCIIAGATGSGKSVCINTIVMSIVMNARPDEIKLLMVDPKKVELTSYTRLPHMLAPVITEPQGAYSAMLWLVKEMERRYELLKQIGVRNIEAFNLRTIDKNFEESLNIEIPAKLPYIVGIVDELADLMMVSSNDIETPIARIAQMARAVGIHLILATQRPSREVITGLIKANFPTRISFKVSSRVNSQIVLDDTGAETLLGNGDMLFLPPGASHLVRAQGAFIRDDDINGVVKFINEQAPPNYVIESFDRYGQLDTSSADQIDTSGDTLYPQALDTVISTGNASTTFLQRKLKIGYARAASLIDMLEQKGIVGPADGSKPRKILVAKHGKEADEPNLFEI
ncbi:MAG: DNA translocase FtsK [Parachlamydiaceae bacterium]|nr:DNA translocase FtsK [Parachlamydiaceae bacterium]